MAINRRTVLVLTDSRSAVASTRAATGSAAASTGSRESGARRGRPSAAGM